MSSDIENIAKARRLVRQVTAQTCLTYNLLCAADCEQKLLSVLQGQLEMACALAKLEKTVVRSD
jgi:hypothetical protein